MQLLLIECHNKRHFKKVYHTEGYVCKEINAIFAPEKLFFFNLKYFFIHQNNIRQYNIATLNR